MQASEQPVLRDLVLVGGGHSHVVALRMFPARAIQSQVPMLVLMVAYTTLSLWILAQPVVG